MENGEIDFMQRNLVDFLLFLFFSPKLIEAAAKEMEQQGHDNLHVIRHWGGVKTGWKAFQKHSVMDSSFWYSPIYRD